MDLLVHDQIDQFRKITANRRGTTVQMQVGKEQLCSIQFDSMRNANVAHEPTWTCRTDGLHHGFLRANALQYGISTDSIRQLFNPRNAIVTAFGYDVGRAELSREFLPWF